MTKNNIVMTRNSFEIAMNLRRMLIGEDVFFVCIGSDRVIGDSLAPLVGTQLKEKGYKNVIGTLDDPVHATNLEEKVKLIPEGVRVVVINPCLGKRENIGKIKLDSGEAKIGKAVGKDLIEIGEYFIRPIVNFSTGDTDFNISILQVTRLAVVFDLAQKIRLAIETAFPLDNGGIYNG
jgi:putative sporulation protein YyaC